MNNLSAIPLPASTSQSAFPVILPAFTEFNRTTWPLATSSFSIFSGGAAGQFRVSLNCSGRACAEFSFAYLTPRRFEVKSTTNLTGIPPPKVQSARFSDDGTYVKVLFDRATDRAGYANYFSCAEVFSYSEAEASTCLWDDSSSVRVLQDSGAWLNVGSNISISALNQVRMACPSGFTDQECRALSTAEVQVFAVAAPLNPIEP
eukprot:gene19510-24702_t